MAHVKLPTVNKRIIGRRKKSKLKLKTKKSLSADTALGGQQDG